MSCVNDPSGLAPEKAVLAGFEGLPPQPARGNIIDIRGDHHEQSLQDAIYKGFHPQGGGEKQLPTLLLYDEAGLKLFEQITYLDEYYLTNAEIEVLEANADRIARALQPGSIVLELGSGNLRKVNILLRAIERLGKHVDYYALDLSLPELQRTLAEVPQGVFKHVKFNALHGTYDDGLLWLQRPEIRSQTKAVLWLGSSIGNFMRQDGAEFLRTVVGVLQNPDSLIIGIDACRDPSTVYHAYNDREGVTHEFYANGLKHANRILGKPVFKSDEWDIIGEYNEAEDRHEAFIAPKQDIEVVDATVKKGEKVRLEQSCKYDTHGISRLWNISGATETFTWSNQLQNYALHMIMKFKYAFPTQPEFYASRPVPSWEEWTKLWAVWDVVTRRMLPEEELLEKPIKLRNACIFYLGHIPTFFDMKLTDATGGNPTPPDYFPKIFERGIDPDVDNPENCHAHSDIPDEWPPLDEVLAFQGRVRDRVKRIYDAGKASNPRIGRVLWLGYEHEAMHLETLLYMLIQSDKTLPPSDTARPNFELLAEQAELESTSNEWFTVPETELVLGMDDPENDSGPSRHFGWDIEKPARKVVVPSFKAKARPISVGEYADYLQHTGQTKIPASWIAMAAINGHANGVANGDTNSANSFLTSHGVRTVYGPVSLEYACSWPVSASYDELAGCAAFMGGRIPIFEEARSIYHYADSHVKDQADKTLGSMIPAVNGHLINNGVQETPPSNGVQVASPNGLPNAWKEDDNPDPNASFMDLSCCNVGFQHWHPTSVTQKGGRLSGQADFGGLWEWTSSALTKHEGYEKMPLYPAYSADFFDGKHNIVLGGSWATIPRIAGRKSNVNWYQRNYPYVWAGARLVKDL